MILDFCTTAMARADIVDRTYRSFVRHLIGVDFKRSTLYINIDPLPATSRRNKVARVAKKYFGNVVVNTPEKANFTAAYNWLWSSCTSEYMFNLEDDWELKAKVPITKLLKPFKNPLCWIVVLRAYARPYRKIPLSPSLMHERFYKKVAGKLDTTINPEIQLRGKNFGIDMPKNGSADRIAVYSKKVIVADIGRRWLATSGYKKPRKGGFITWIEK